MVAVREIAKIEGEAPPLARFLVLAIAALLTVATPLLGQETEAGFTPLFDGRSLDGWIAEGSDAGSFTPEENAIRIRGPRGWLRTEERFGDFDLRLEFRFLTEGADSGLFLRAASPEGFGRAWPNPSYQIQLRDMNAPSTFLPLGHIYRHGMPQGEANHHGDVVVEHYRGVGEWHPLEVGVEGGSVVVLLDGREVLRATGIGNDAGWIGFQGEAGEVEYRAIRIRRR